jgi:prepilin-type N-terminal cleavage/methylation domain-containing protein
MADCADTRSSTICPARLRSGFSLIELVVALAVMSVAIGIFVQLFGSSLDLARQGRDHTIAAGLADAQLNTIVQRPNDFRWERDPEAEERPFPIRLATDDPRAGNPFAGPEALPAEVGLDVREKALYDAFRWKAFGRIVPGQPYAEVTVVVNWEEAQRERKVALTSAVPLQTVTAWATPTPESVPEEEVEAGTPADQQPGPESEEAPPATEEEAA